MVHHEWKMVLNVQDGNGLRDAAYTYRNASSRAADQAVHPPRICAEADRHILEPIQELYEDEDLGVEVSTLTYYSLNNPLQLTNFEPEWLPQHA